MEHVRVIKNIGFIFKLGTYYSFEFKIDLNLLVGFFLKHVPVYLLLGI